MKKTLFGTTALVTAGLLASSGAHAEGGIKLGLGGYMNNFFGIGDSDLDNLGPTGLYSDGEVHFKGETTLDNGLTFGANVQLESFGDTNDTIDEDYGYMEGGFGRLQFGSENTAAYLMQYASPSVGAPINSGWVTSFVPAPAGATAGFRTPSLSTYVDIGNDENTVTYFTPRMFGFQVGLSYQPALVFTGDGKDFPIYADEDTEYNNGVSVGVNFVDSFGGVDVAVAAGYRHADGPNDNIVALTSQGVAGTNNDGTVQTFSRSDLEQISFGANIGFAGFTLGGSYANETSGRVTPTTGSLGTLNIPGSAGVIGAFTTLLPSPFTSVSLVDASTVVTGANSTEGHSWDVGVSYSTGPWAFGVAYFHGEAEGSLTVPGQNEMYAIRGAVEYAVGPGITASLSGMYADWDTEINTSNDGFAGIFGVNFGF
jgi:predicted porin